jgi:hypothetical protein
VGAQVPPVEFAYIQFKDTFCHLTIVGGTC